MKGTSLTKRELQVIKDKEFLSVKAKALSKIEALLSETQSKLEKVFPGYNLPFPSREVFKAPKISKGENYLGFPYRVLDYPAIFSSEKIFAYRTMFWWGNFFSATIHLQGESLDYYRKKIIENISRRENSEIYICVGKTPWQYHYESDNYVLLTADHADYIQNCPFLKLSKKTDLDNRSDIAEFSLSFFKEVVTILND